MGAGGARSLVLGSALGLCVALLVGCSSPEPAPITPAPPADELEAYADAIFAGLDLEAQTRQQQDFIAVCMNDLGFDYLPTLVGITLHRSTEVDPAEAEAYRLAEGWGVTAESTGTGKQRPGTTEELTDHEVDPNEEIVDAMSATARQAWVTAQMDCQVQAWEMSSVGGVLAARPDLAALHEEIIKLNEDESDPRWQDLNARWARCMTDRGYLGYTAPSLASFDFGRAYGEVPAVEPDQIEEQRALEVATTTADLDCRTELDYDTAVAGIREERATEFIVEHKTAMDEMLLILQEALPRLPEDPTP